MTDERNEKGVLLNESDLMIEEMETVIAPITVLAG